MNTRYLCFKATRNMHESGFRYIEYGYMTFDEAGNEQIEVVGRYDVVLGTSFLKETITFHLDLTKSGWFRVMARTDTKLEWSYGGEIVEEGKSL